MLAGRDASFRDAQALQRSRRLLEAIAAYQRLLQQWPDHAASWFNLGYLLRQIGRLGEALACYQQALDHRISNPEEAHLNRGVIYADYLRDDVSAERELRAALALDPAYIPALLNLAKIQEDRGLRAAALEIYYRVLDRDPGCAVALARRAYMLEPAECSPPIIAELSAAATNPRQPASDRALLGFALGRVLDACNAHEKAYAAYAAANDAVRADRAAGWVPYDRALQEQFIDRLIAAAPASATRAASAEPQKPQPIFICGMFRSGSTLIEQLLERHPDVAAGGELDLLPSWAAGELAPYPESLVAVPGPDSQSLARRYRESLRALFPRAGLVTDKRPDNFLLIGLIKRLFPDAKIVHTTRHPLDNCLSVYFLHLDEQMSYATDLLDIGHYYRQYRRLMDHWRRLYGPDIIDVSYDRFVADPQATGSALFQSLGLEWKPQFVELPRTGGSVRTASLWQVREPLYRRSSGRHRHYARQLSALGAYLADLLPTAGGGSRQQ